MVKKSIDNTEVTMKDVLRSLKDINDTISKVDTDTDITFKGFLLRMQLDILRHIKSLETIGIGE